MPALQKKWQYHLGQAAAVGHQPHKQCEYGNDDLAYNPLSGKPQSNEMTFLGVDWLFVLLTTTLKKWLL